MKIISKRKRVRESALELHFTDLQNEGCGFAFDVFKNLEPQILNEAARRNYIMCVEHPERYRNDGLVERHWEYTEYASGECDDCGKAVYLDSFTNECDCGALYNMSGQRLAPREQWGEETGEHPADIYNNFPIEDY